MTTKARYTMTRWTGLAWVHHSVLSRTETRAMLASLRSYRGDWTIASVMSDLDNNEVIQTHGYRFQRVKP